MRNQVHAKDEYQKTEEDGETEHNRKQVNKENLGKSTSLVINGSSEQVSKPHQV